MFNILNIFRRRGKGGIISHSPTLEVKEGKYATVSTKDLKGALYHSSTVNQLIQNTSKKKRGRPLGSKNKKK